jgi:hypothetical protein
MPLHLIQLTDQEWMDWNAVIGAARLLRARSEEKPSPYKGAIADNEAGKSLRADLNALVAASKKVIEVDD